MKKFVLVIFQIQFKYVIPLVEFLAIMILESIKLKLVLNQN